MSDRDDRCRHPIRALVRAVISRNGLARLELGFECIYYGVGVWFHPNMHHMDMFGADCLSSKSVPGHPIRKTRHVRAHSHVHLRPDPEAGRVFAAARWIGGSQGLRLGTRHTQKGVRARAGSARRVG